MALTTYGHVIEELEGTEKQIPEEVIRRARDELVRTTFARDRGSRRAPKEKSLQIAESPLADSNRRPLSMKKGRESRGVFVSPSQGGRRGGGGC